MARVADCLPGEVKVKPVAGLAGLPLLVWSSRVDGSPEQAGGKGRRVSLGQLVLGLRRQGIRLSVRRQAWPLPADGCRFELWMLPAGARA